MKEFDVLEGDRLRAVLRLGCSSGPEPGPSLRSQLSGLGEQGCRLIGGSDRGKGRAGHIDCRGKEVVRKRWREIPKLVPEFG